MESPAMNMEQHCALIIATDGSKDLLIHCLKLNEPSVEGLERFTLRNSSREIGPFRGF